jgi:hypothetical protein
MTAPVFFGLKGCFPKKKGGLAKMMRGFPVWVWIFTDKPFRNKTRRHVVRRP